MPQLKIQTNVEIDPSRREDLIHKASSEVADMLGKPEKFVMIILETECDMSMSGSTEACAYLELKSIGLPQDRTTEFSSRLCNFIEAHLAIAPERTYIEFTDIERHLFGWDSKTF